MKGTFVMADEGDHCVFICVSNAKRQETVRLDGSIALIQVVWRGKTAQCHGTHQPLDATLVQTWAQKEMQAPETFQELLVRIGEHFTTWCVAHHASPNQAFLGITAEVAFPARWPFTATIISSLLCTVADGRRKRSIASVQQRIQPPLT